MPKKEESLKPILNQIENSLKTQNSLRHVFVQGLVRGLGTAIGATILLAILTSLAYKLSSNIDITAFLAQFFSGAF